MKRNLNVIFFVAVALFVSACSDNDSNNSANDTEQNSNKTTAEENFVVIGKQITVTKDNAATTILNLTEDATIIVQGGINTVTLNAIGAAMKENSSPKISIDFSNTTGMTEITSDMFNFCKSLYSIKLPNSLTTLEWYAFAGCINLKSITIPDSVTTTTHAAGSMFRDCTSLETVTIGSGLSKFGGSYFSGCTALKKVIIRGSYDNNEESDQFLNCNSLEEMEIYGNVCNGAFSKNKTIKKVILGSGNNEDNVIIEYNAFFGCETLCDIEFRNGISKLDTGAFSSCDNLKSISLPSTMEVLGDHAFDSCKNLESVNLNTGLISIGYSCFSACLKLSKIILPNTLRDIYGSTFSHTGLKP